MKTHRTIIFIVGLLVALSAVMPASALASPLLSGYGGPGQGSQAILGTALLNGPGGGGGSAGANGSSTTGASSVTAPISQGSGVPTRSAAPGKSPVVGRGKHAAGAPPSAGEPHAAAGGNAQGSADEMSLGTSSLYPVSERGAVSQEGGMLGLSGADRLYVILALGMLAFMGVLTRRLTRTTPSGKRR
jgi:hypothetical protein